MSSEASTPGPVTPLPARYFDGRSSRPLPCQISLLPAPRSGGIGLRIDALADQRDTDTGAPKPLQPALREFAAAQIEWPDAGETRRALIRFDDGSQAQLDDPAALSEALRLAGWRAPALHALAARMARSWRALAAGALACLALAALTWLVAVPAAARVITHLLPPQWEDALGARTLQTLDAAWLAPSTLSAERQAQISAEFDSLIARSWPAASVPRYRLHFRAVQARAQRSASAANALALPGGLLVMTDELVALAPPDQPAALLGVLAHELGHVKGRHSTRMAVEGSLLAVAVAVISGDPTSVLASVPLALTTLSFSRSHELEADCYALQTLRAAKESAEPLAQLLETLTKAVGAGPVNVLSSHPATPERVRLLRDSAAAQRACSV